MTDRCVLWGCVRVISTTVVRCLSALLILTGIASATAGEPLWGMAGGYAGIDLKDLASRGVRLTLVEIDWWRAEPKEGKWNKAYLNTIRAEIAGHRALGFEVILNYGMHAAPRWLLEKPNARFINQHGAPFMGGDEPNLVWATELRPLAERYSARVFTELGTNFFAVRVGGGHWGELTYPQVFKADGKVENLYWAFDGVAARSNPVPGWKPGSPSTAGEAQRFLTWYLDALAAYQNWQVSMVRASYPGPIAVLYPSWGLRAGDLEKAVATGLDGTSPPEVRGLVQRGFDHARQVGALKDRNAAVWCTWGENENVLAWLAGLADAKGLRKMAENAGGNDARQMEAAMRAARAHGLSVSVWIRAGEAYAHKNGWATIDDYSANIAAGRR